MIQEALAKVVEGRDLTEAEMTEVMDLITDGKVTAAQIGALMVGLRMKGEHPGEIAAAARVLRSKSTPVPVGAAAVSVDRDEINVDMETLIDTCGTGGDGTNTFNISTTTAFVVAGAGLKVAKHGNRSVSSRCGSADVVEAMGVPLDLTPDEVGECVDKVGIGFLYAPMLHGAMRHVAVPRREIGLRSIFNLVGPLTNPARATVQVLGVYRKDLTLTMAEALKRLGCRSAFVVHGAGSYDELSVTGPSLLARLVDGEISTWEVEPESVGLRRAEPEEILGGDAQENAKIVLDVLSGTPGARRDVVLLNAAAVFVAAGKAQSLREGVEIAAESIDSGSAMKRLEHLVALSTLFSSRRKASSAGSN